MISCKVGNYSFQWTDLHPSPSDLHPLRYQYDELGSKVVNKLQEIAAQTKEKQSGHQGEYVDLYALLRDHHSEHEVLTRFWNEVYAVPEWVDWEQLRRGQRFFYRYAPANIMGFALQGFMGENSAAAGVVEVLVRTGGFSTRKLLRRLLETFQFILQVTESLEALQPGGTGHITTIRVRLLHSSVRERILRNIKIKPDYFDMETAGVPVNILDSIHSISTFSCNHTWLQLPFLGVRPSPQETADYIALFRYVGYVLGTPDEYFETTARAKATMESMLVHESRLTPTSSVVAYNFIQCLTDLPPVNLSAQFIEAGSRVLNGDEFCDKLGLGHPGLYAYTCFRGYCRLVALIAFLQQTIPAVDKAVTNYFKRMLHEGVIHSKAGLAGGSKLEFKHVPQVGMKIGKEAHGRAPIAASFLARPFEAFLFTFFIMRWLIIIGLFLGILRVVRLASLRAMNE